METLEYIGASWCAPCRTVKPEVQRLAQNFGIPLTVVDYDAMEEKEQEAVSKLPTIRIWKDRVLQETITMNHIPMLESWLKTHIVLRVNAEEDF